MMFKQKYDTLIIDERFEITEWSRDKQNYKTKPGRFKLLMKF